MRTDAAVRRGDDARVDVLCAPAKVGHFFPGGTVDAFDVWLELQAPMKKADDFLGAGKWRKMARSGRAWGALLSFAADRWARQSH